MDKNEKNDCIYHISTIFCPGLIVLEESHCLMFCQLNFHWNRVNFHKIFNQTGVGGSDSAACKNEIYQFLQML